MALKDAVKQISEARKVFQKQLKEATKEARKEIGQAFAEVIPEGGRIRWNQHTPNFNDGDPCEFHVYGPPVIISKDDDELEEYEDTPEWLTDKARKAIYKLWDEVDDEDLMLEMFGDHATVTIDAKGKVEVDQDYDHD